MGGQWLGAQILPRWGVEAAQVTGTAASHLGQSAAVIKAQPVAN